MPGATPSQTIGPFFAEGLQWAIDATAAAPFADAVQIAGRVLDADAQGVADALLEIWQPAEVNEAADAASGGARSLRGFQRVATDAEGRFNFWMPRPQRRTLHADVTLFARGLLRGLFTRVYIAADVAGLDIPSNVPTEKSDSLRPKKISPHVYSWDIRLSGKGETAFFDL